MRKLFLSFLFFLNTLPFLGAQDGTKIMGRVVDERSGEGIPYVNISFRGTQKGVSSDEQGYFRIEEVKAGEYHIVVSTVGYEKMVQELELSDGEEVESKVQLRPKVHEEGEVVVTANMKAESRTDASVNVSTLDRKDLNFGGADPMIDGLEQMNGVREQVVCGVCGTNGIRVNGMESPYTLMMLDGMPSIGSLGAVYGLDGIPSSLVERIEVTKGPASTLYGPRAVAGVVNVMTRDPSDMPRVELKADHNTHGQTQAQATFRPDLGSDSLHTFFSVDHSRSDRRVDENGDGFTDFPLEDRLSLFNKWSWTGAKGGKGGVALRHYREERFGGVMDWQPDDKGTEKAYGESIETRRTELLGNFEPGVEANLRMGFSVSDHFQDSYYGTEHYKGKQRTGFAYTTWRKEFGDHEFLSGMNLRYRSYQDNTPVSANDERLIPGLFVQDEWELDSFHTITGAFRVDRHGKHGTIFTPRLHFKKELSERTTLRLNSGSGFREVDVFTEDHAALTGSRQLVLEEELRPERSWNVSSNLSRSHHAFGGVGSMDFDLFYTRFSNKIVPDLNSDPDAIIYRNLQGHGVSCGVALSLAHRFHFPLKLEMGGTYQDVYLVRQGEGREEKVRELYSPRFTGNFSVKGTIPGIELECQWKGNVIGPQRLPEYPAPYRRPVNSPWYSLHHLHFKRAIGKGWGIYAGVKNLFDRTQSSSLIAPERPFSSEFDTEYVYAPIQGRRIYFGMEWRMGE